MKLCALQDHIGFTVNLIHVQFRNERRNATWTGEGMEKVPYCILKTFLHPILSIVRVLLLEVVKSRSRVLFNQF